MVSNILEGIHQIVVLPTGSGKSLCFQLPSRVLPGPTLVMLPLLSLLTDQMRKLTSAGAPVACLRGGQTPAERETLFADLQSGKTRLLLATPEACLVPAVEARLAACRVSHFVVDEAHCISEWGESFRPAYLELGKLAERIGAALVTAFTATASPAVIGTITENLFRGRDVRVVAAAADRPNISYSVVSALSRMRALTVLAGRARGATLVFCRTRQGVERAARTLARRGISREIRFYHAGLTRSERARAEEWFLSSHDGILAATTAYGMGVDKPDIRTVIHADVPASVESYLQETGRAGRDGEPAEAALISSPEDARFLAQLPPGIPKDRFTAMLGYASSHGACRRERLLSLIGQEPPACSGCDVCSGAEVLAPEGQAEILGFIQRHKRRFSREQAVETLIGARGPRVVRDCLDRVGGYGLLSGWVREDAEEVMDELLAAGLLRVNVRGLWAGRVTTGRSDLSCAPHPRRTRT